MPVVINEIEILERPDREAAAGSPQASPPPAEPANEQLRRYLRDVQVRQRRLVAD
jgi:hypothetical protein